MLSVNYENVYDKGETFKSAIIRYIQISLV